MGQAIQDLPACCGTANTACWEIYVSLGCESSMLTNSAGTRPSQHMMAVPGNRIDTLPRYMEGVSDKNRTCCHNQAIGLRRTLHAKRMPLYSHASHLVWAENVLLCAKSFVRVNYLHLSAAPFEGCLSAASMLHFNLSQEILRKSHKLLTIDTFKFQTCPFLRCHTFNIWTSQRAHLLPPSVWQCLIVPYTLRVSINNCYVFLRTHIVLIRSATASANFCTRLQPAS